MSIRKLQIFILLLACSLLAAAEYKLVLKADKKDGIYKAGETAEFSCQVLKDGKTVEGMDVRYLCSLGKKTLRGKFISSNEPWKIQVKSNTPSWCYIAFSLHGKDGKMLEIAAFNWEKWVKRKNVGVGALWEPEKFLPAYPEPADFDEFWDKVKAELAAVPMKELEKVKVTFKGINEADSESVNKRVDVYDIKVSCAGEKPVSGYLALPKNAKPKSLPAYVSFHGAGVRSSDINIARRACNGVLALDINAHGIVNGKPKKFYTELHNGKLKGYSHAGKNNRDTFYFKGMYMRVMRSLDYVKTLPEWDGKHLVVTGASQGGAQVFAACALDKDVTYAVAGVPAMSDHSGCLAKRDSGWPKLYKATDGKPVDPAVAEAVAYYDNAYFAKRIKCPININTGLYDTTCVPTSVFAAYNMIPETTEKYMTVVPDGGHGATHASGAKRRDAYLNRAIKANKNK